GVEQCHEGACAVWTRLDLSAVRAVKFSVSNRLTSKNAEIPYLLQSEAPLIAGIGELEKSEIGALNIVKYEHRSGVRVSIPHFNGAHLDSCGMPNVESTGRRNPKHGRSGIVLFLLGHVAPGVARFSPALVQDRKIGESQILNGMIGNSRNNGGDARRSRRSTADMAEGNPANDTHRHASWPAHARP